MKKIILLTILFFTAVEISYANECSKKGTPREATKCVELKLEEIEKRISGGVSIPKDAVLAFASASCPPNWDVYKKGIGRVVVGSGLATGLSPRVYDQMGGSETHTLAINEIPIHAHSHVDDGVYYKPASRYEGLRTEFKGDSSVGLTHGSRSTGNQGGNHPHNNMPPFVVLTLCKQR